MLSIRAVSERTHRLPEPQWLRSSAGPAVAVSVCIAEGEMERMAIKVGQKADIAYEDNLRYMRKLPDRLMRLIVTSPPYNIGKAYEPQKTRKLYIEEQATCIAEVVRLLHPRAPFVGR